MPFPNEDTQFKPGQSGNPLGKPKGIKHISTHIQELLNDPEFTIDNWQNSGNKFDGVPLKAIITVGVYNALQGDQKWADWLGKYGWGTKTSNETTVHLPKPILDIADVRTNDSNTEG